MIFFRIKKKSAKIRTAIPSNKTSIWCGLNQYFLTNIFDVIHFLCLLILCASCFSLQSLKSQGYVREQFAWRHFYWYLTNEGIEYLRNYLHLPAEIVPQANYFTGILKTEKKTIANLVIQLTLIVSNSVDSNFRLSQIFIEVPNFVVYKYI
jgi:hypothetical protein